MGWRTVVVSKPAKLDLKLGYMVVRDHEQSVKVHISEISILIVETTAVSLTTALLSELTRQKVKVVFCDEKQTPLAELIPYYGCHDNAQKIRSQIAWRAMDKQAVWTVIVAQKIRMQANVLRSFDEHDAAQLLEKYIAEMEFNDETNREGHAAKVYFNALFGKAFSRNEECPVNAALNYGYSLILSCVNREIVCNGYLTQLGLCHDNMFNSFNLGCDLMEPFRPYIDQLVRTMECLSFETEHKRQLQAVLHKEVLFCEQHRTLSDAIKGYCRSVFDAVENSDPSLLKFAVYEL